MTQDNMTSPESRLRRALSTSDASVRLQTALTAGIHTDDAYLPVLIERCSVEPDFYVRDMLTWAITRQDRTKAVDLLLPELDSTTAQARSQALHSLSKLGDRRAWSAITVDLLRDDDVEVAKAAWRTAAGLAPESEHPALARDLARNLGRGDRELQRSLSRAIAMLGPAAESVVDAATDAPDPGVREHALATAHVMAYPDDGFEAAIEEARRVVALRDARTVGDD
ncbi:MULTISPECIES: HEAT repeat domain-containing protein [unclassified Microbacterium]|uniref:HEAT repeat domain-containing protein n=1 Tax=unclassified Microbacterium TaxID=2609290 RepID=UPI00056887BF|nr:MULTISPECIES: HEAT repeat domain-containing protein [unclassified Microbacterium]